MNAVPVVIHDDCTSAHNSKTSFKHTHKSKNTNASKHNLRADFLNNNTILKYLTFNNDKFCVSYKKLMLSGDIELNPGPLNSISVHNVLENRLQQLGLKPLDVGGEGDCFF